MSFIGCIPLSGLKICCTGAIFFNDCPVQRFIPIYLIVGGAFAFWGFVSALVQLGCNLADPDRDHAAFSHFCRVTESLVGFFTFAWFIAGNILHPFVSLCLHQCLKCKERSGGTPFPFPPFSSPSLPSLPSPSLSSLPLSPHLHP